MGALLAFLVLAGAGRTLAVVRPALAPGDEAPRLSALPLAEHAPRKVAWGEARLTLVNFWATWCQPCRSEIPALEGLRKRHEGEGFAVVGVLLDKADDPAAAEFLAALGASYTVLRGTSDISEEWGGIGVLPTSFLVNTQGRVVRRYVGASEPTIRRMEADVAALLAAAPAPAAAPPAPKPPPAAAKPAAPKKK